MRAEWRILIYGFVGVLFSVCVIIDILVFHFQMGMQISNLFYERWSGISSKAWYMVLAFVVMAIINVGIEWNKMLANYDKHKGTLEYSRELVKENKK